MFRAILVTQWKWTRLPLLLATLAAFTIPLASLALGAGGRTASEFILGMRTVQRFYPMLAAGVGLLVALLAWGHDHRGRHVYALSLPIARWRYTFMRLGSGGVFLLPPVIGVLAGGGLVALSGLVPAGLHTYVFSLGLRFAFASAVAFALFFAIASATSRTAGFVLAVIAAFVLLQYGIDIGAASNLGVLPAMNAVFGESGILSLFSGNWLLVDA